MIACDSSFNTIHGNISFGIYALEEDRNHLNRKFYGFIVMKMCSNWNEKRSFAQIPHETWNMNENFATLMSAKYAVHHDEQCWTLNTEHLVNSTIELGEKVLISQFMWKLRTHVNHIRTSKFILFFFLYCVIIKPERSIRIIRFLIE